MTRNQRTNAVLRFAKTMLVGAALVVITNGSLLAAQFPTPADCPTSNKDRITAYKFLAELTYHRVKSGQYKTAAIAAKNLDFTWDQTNGCLQALGVSHEEALNIDGLMDAFLGAAKGDGNAAPDLTVVSGAYKKYIDELDRLK